MSYRYPTPRSSFSAKAESEQNGSKNQHDTSHRSHTDRVRKEMKDLGVSPLAMLRPESLYLPKIINEDETLTGIVYGHDQRGSLMVTATDQRILLVMKRPMFIEEEEIDYELVSGISYYSGLISSVILHTRVGDFRVHTFNHGSALKFIGYIEERCLDTVLGPSRLWRAT